MSAFLGPIHHWLYNKIQIQNNWVGQLVEQAFRTDILEKQYGVVETKPLEEVIQTDNIHGWLQKQVGLVEYHFAATIKRQLELEHEKITALTYFFTEEGRQSGEAYTNCTDMKQLYKVINDTWLDGMPCDHANHMLVVEAEKVVWEVAVDVHASYWQEVGIDSTIYHQLKKAWLSGFAEASGAKLTITNNQYTLER